MLATKNRDVVAKLKFPFLCLLRNINIGAALYRREDDVRISCHAQDVILESLPLKRELVQDPRTKSIGMVHNQTLKLVGIRVSSGKVRRLAWVKLIVGRVVLLERVAIEHCLPRTQVM